MKRINALKFRQLFGSVLDEVEEGSEAIVIERSSKPIAVLIPFAEFERRFIDRLADEKRKTLIDQFRSSLESSTVPSLKALRDIRYGQSD